jgi:hypothetical protein
LSWQALPGSNDVPDYRGQLTEGLAYQIVRRVQLPGPRRFPLQTTMASFGVPVVL